MKPAANLSLLWQDLPYGDRFDAAAEAGFRAVEILFPYEVPARETQEALARNGLRLILVNAPPPNYTGTTERGFAAHPDLRDRFRHDMKRALRYAAALRVPFVHVMAGEAKGEAAFDTMVENLKWAARQAPDGVTLTIEPLNPVDMPGYFLNDYEQAARVLNAVRRANVALQFDAYHAQVIHGSALDVWNRFGHRAVHVQLGDAPGRVPPGKGEIDFRALFQSMRDCGYKGWISGEYHPGGPTEKTLGWVKMMEGGK